MEPAVDFFLHAAALRSAVPGAKQSSPARSALSCHPPEDRLRLRVKRFRFQAKAIARTATLRCPARERKRPWTTQYGNSQQTRAVCGLCADDARRQARTSS